MQVCALGAVAVEGYRDVVAAAGQVFGVQGLVDVADEVQDEFQGFVAGAEGIGGVEEEGGLFGPCVKNRVCCVSWACI